MSTSKSDPGNVEDAWETGETEPLLDSGWSWKDRRLLLGGFLLVSGIVSGTYFWVELLPAFEQDTSLGWTKANTTWTETLGAIGECVGLLIMGPLADCLPGDILLCFELVMVCAILLCVSASPSPSIIIFLVVVGCSIKGIMWPTVGALISTNLPKTKHDTCFLLTALGSRVGDACNAMILGLSMTRFNFQWRNALIVLLVFILIEFTVAICLLQSVDRLVQAKDEAPSVGGQLYKWRRLCTSFNGWLAWFTLLGCYCVWALIGYVSVILQDVFALDPGVAAASMICIPIGSVLGLLFGASMSSVMSLNAARTVHVVISFAGVLILVILATTPASYAVTLLLLGSVGFCFVVPAYLPYLVYAASCSSEDRAFCLGTLDGTSSAFGALFLYVFGSIRSNSTGIGYVSKLYAITAAALFIASVSMMTLYYRLSSAELTAESKDSGYSD